MDKRILKTKRMLKQALFALMQKKPFQSITVKEICTAADTSRNTFYVYYDDKYALVEEIARDMKAEISARYTELQSYNNPGDEAVRRYLNVMDAILDIEDRYAAFFLNAKRLDSMDVQIYYYQYIQKGIAEIVGSQESFSSEKYPAGELSAFLVAGCWGYINEAERKGRLRGKTRHELRSLMERLMRSGILFM